MPMCALLWQLSSMASLGNPSKMRINITRKCSTKSNVLDHQNQQQRLLIKGQTSEQQHLESVAISRVSCCVTVCKKFFGKSGYWLAKPCYSRWVAHPESSSHSNFQMQPIVVREEWIRFLVPRPSPCKYVQWLFQIWDMFFDPNHKSRLLEPYKRFFISRYMEPDPLHLASFVWLQKLWRLEETHF